MDCGICRRETGISKGPEAGRGKEEGRAGGWVLGCVWRHLTRLAWAFSWNDGSPGEFWEREVNAASRGFHKAPPSGGMERCPGFRSEAPGIVPVTDLGR